jgi:hypothetical protein
MRAILDNDTVHLKQFGTFSFMNKLKNTFKKNRNTFEEEQA